MTIKIPDLTIASALFFLFALILTAFARWFSRYGKKTDNTRKKASAQNVEPKNFNQQIRPSKGEVIVDRATPLQTSAESSKKIREEEQASPVVIQETAPMSTDAPIAEQESLKGENTPAQE